MREFNIDLQTCIEDLKEDFVLAALWQSFGSFC